MIMIKNDMRQGKERENYFCIIVIVASFVCLKFQQASMQQVATVCPQLNSIFSTCQQIKCCSLIDCTSIQL